MSKNFNYFYKTLAMSNDINRGEGLNSVFSFLLPFSLGRRGRGMRVSSWEA
jgi:hypothetical protein